MSLALHPLGLVRTMEPRTRIYNDRKYCVLEGARESTYKTYISTSWSNSSVVFTCPPPNPNIIVDRKLLLNMQFLVTINTTGGVTGFIEGLSGPRARPIPQVITTTSVALNDSRINMNTSDILLPFLHYKDNSIKREIHDSLSPSMLDQAQNYSDIPAGSSRNVFLPYTSSVSGADTTRGSFSYTVLTNTAGSATILLDVTDFMFLPPFLSEQEEGPGFIQLQTMDFTFTMANDLSRVWSAMPVATSSITSITASINAPPRLLFNYLTPNFLLPIPQSVPYPYYEVQRYPTNVGSIAPNGIVSLAPSSNIQLKSIPNRMYVFARRRNQDQTVFTSDVFAAIDQISIQWNNRNGLLSSASAQSLWRTSQENGLCLSWTQTQKYNGLPLCLVFGKDICLDADEAPGKLGTYQLQLNATVRNINQSETINFDLYIITVSEGTLWLENNRCVTQVGVISSGDIVNIKNAPMVDYNEVNNFSGASFWSNIKSFFSDVGRGVKKAYDTVAPVIKDAMPIIQGIKTLTGHGMMGGVPSGGSTYSDFLKKNGGKGLSRAQLTKMYYQEQGAHCKKIAKKVKAAGKPAKKRKAPKKKKAAPKKKRVVKKKKGGVLYEGGELIDRSDFGDY